MKLSSEWRKAFQAAKDDHERAENEEIVRLIETDSASHARAIALIERVDALLAEFDDAAYPEKFVDDLRSAAVNTIGIWYFG